MGRIGTSAAARVSATCLLEIREPATSQPVWPSVSPTAQQPHPGSRETEAMELEAVEAQEDNFMAHWARH